MIDQLREALNVPKELRIAQHIYNVMRENGYEEKMDVMLRQDGKFTQQSMQGIDIFYVKDAEFINLMGKKYDR